MFALLVLAGIITFVGFVGMIITQPRWWGAEGTRIFAGMLAAFLIGALGLVSISIARGNEPKPITKWVKYTGVVEKSAFVDGTGLLYCLVTMKDDPRHILVVSGIDVPHGLCDSIKPGHVAKVMYKDPINIFIVKVYTWEFVDLTQELFDYEFTHPAEAPAE